MVSGWARRAVLGRAVLALAVVACKPREPPREQVPVVATVAVADADAWVRPMAGGRYLATGDGTPFIPIGNQPGTGFLDLPDSEIDAYFARMQATGENVARLDLDYAYPSPRGTTEPPRYVGLEATLGELDPVRAARIDRVFALARQHDVRLLIVPWVTSPPMWETWAANPYATTRGGPAADPHAFMVSAVARAAFARRLDAIIARWGGTSTLFGWDLMNEANILEAEGHTDPRGLETWVAELGAHVAQTERARFGREHLRMVSSADMIPAPAYGFLFRSPALNVAATHPYDFYGTTIDTLPAVVTSVVEPALTAHAKVRRIVRDLVVDRRPYLEDERHQNTQTTLGFYQEADHAMAWAELVAGAAGTGMTWMVLPEGPFMAATALEDRHRALGPGRLALHTFVTERVPRAFFTIATTDEADDALASSDPGVAVMSLRRADHVIGWLLGRDERCVLAEAVREGRADLARDPRALVRAGLAVALWRKLLRGEGVAVDDGAFAPVVAAFKARDVEAGRRAFDRAFAYLDDVDRGTRARLATCPTLAPEVTFKLSAGAYRVDWIDDTTARVIRTDQIEGGATVTAPGFARHLAVVVSPTAAAGTFPARSAPRVESR